MPGSGIAEDEVDLGRISGVHGVTGHVRLFLHNPGPFLCEAVRDVVLVDPDGRRWGAKLRAEILAEKKIRGRLTGVKDRNAARAFKDWTITVSVASLPDLDADEFYVWEVEGLSVVVDGTAVGTVVTVHETPGGDLFEIRIGTEHHFVPSIQENVVSLDIAAGVLIVAPEAVEGLSSSDAS